MRSKRARATFAGHERDSEISWPRGNVCRRDVHPGTDRCPPHAQPPSFIRGALPGLELGGAHGVVQHEGVHEEVRLVQEGVLEAVEELREVETPPAAVADLEASRLRVVEEVAAYFQRDHEVITIDGARVLFGEGWGLLRASNTQPVLVLRFEAQTPEALAEIEGTFREVLGRYPEVEWSA